jgi:hypothetical protein
MIYKIYTESTGVGGGGGDDMRQVAITGMNLLAPQGWQCPLCQRAYSPTTPMCFYCPSTTTTQPNTYPTTGKAPPFPYSTSEVKDE